MSYQDLIRVPMRPGDRTSVSQGSRNLLIVGAVCLVAAGAFMWARVPYLTRWTVEHNEQAATTRLRKIVDAQSRFFHEDLDENGLKDYWRRDIAGLYSAKTRNGWPIQGIELAI